MKPAIKFSISSKWKMLLLDMGIDPTLALTHAQLPLDLFSRAKIQLNTEEYFRLWNGIDAVANSKEVALLLAKYVSAESFDPPIFAALCCQNLNTALDRLSHYKPLIGPMRLTVTKTNEYTELQLKCEQNVTTMPYALCMSEAVFFTQLARIGTRDTIQPTQVIVPVVAKQLAAYKDYFGCSVTQGENLIVRFKAEDATKPFLTASDAMWEFFEDNLNQQLQNLTHTATTSERVKSVLLKALPSGEMSIDFVASSLAMSKRTLQRKLTEDADTFQSILLSVRAELAHHYLKQPDLSLGEIAYLLGFKEPSSFIRAFSNWTGTSPTAYRSQNKH